MWKIMNIKWRDYTVPWRPTGWDSRLPLQWPRFSPGSRNWDPASQRKKKELSLTKKQIFSSVPQSSRLCIGMRAITLSQGRCESTFIARKVLSITSDTMTGAWQTVVTIYYLHSYCQMATRTLLGKAEWLTRPEVPHRHKETRHRETHSSSVWCIFLVLCLTPVAVLWGKTIIIPTLQMRKLRHRPP